MTEPDLEFSDCYEREDYLAATKKDRWNQAKENFADAFLHWLSFRRGKLWFVACVAIITYQSGPWLLVGMALGGLAALFQRFYNWLKA